MVRKTDGTITMTVDEAKELIGAINMHEAERPEFRGTDYSEAQWNSISGLIVITS